jgi:hypothetical protein
VGEGALALWLARSTDPVVNFHELPRRNVPAPDVPQLFWKGADGKSYDVVGVYAPFLSKVSGPGTRVLLSGKDVDGAIADILVVHREVLEQHREKVERLLEGWFEAVDILNNPADDRYRQALKWARLFNGKAPNNRLDANNLRANSPCSEWEYKKMSAASQMRWGDWQANLDFFDRPGGMGASKYHKLYLKHQGLMRADLSHKADPADSDGSSILRDLEGE